MSRILDNLPVIRVGAAVRAQLDAEVEWLRAHTDAGATLSSVVRSLLVEGLAQRARARSQATRPSEPVPRGEGIAALWPAAAGSGR